MVVVLIAAFLACTGLVAWAQDASSNANNQPSQNEPSQSHSGDSQSTEESPSPARARLELISSGYLRTLWAAQREYQKKNGRYATSLAALVGQGSFTKRMAQPKRGEYTVRFHSDGTSYAAELVPAQFDPEHPAFYIDENGVVRSEQDKPATASSPQVRKPAP